jgi:hypothetical protein
VSGNEIEGTRPGRFECVVEEFGINFAKATGDYRRLFSRENTGSGL